MKKLLSIFSALTLTVTSLIVLVSCSNDKDTGGMEMVNLVVEPHVK